MSCRNINAMNQQTIEQGHAQYNTINRDHIDSFSANSEQRKYLHEASSLEQRTLWNSSSSSCCQPSKHHSRHGEPLYRSLLKPHHCSQPSFMDYVEGVHHRHHKQCLFESENTETGNCFSPQCMHYSPCRCGSPMLHETNTRIRSSPKGQSYYPNRALSNEITLYNWYLIRSGDSHSSDIAVGGFLSSRGTDVERIETTTIVKRLEEGKLLTKDGDVINLVGPIDDYRTVSNGFTLQTAHLFISGFPHIWNLLVGMGLPAKAARTVTSSQSCDFHGGEVTFQERLWKETSGQRECIQHCSAFEELGEDLASYPEGERKSGATHGMKELQVLEADGNIVKCAALLEQDNSLLIGECQSKEDPLPLHDRIQKKDSDKKAGLEGSCAEGSHHEASHAQRSTASELAEATNVACELDNMPVESVKAAVSEIAFGDEECEIATEKNVENGGKENHANQAFVEATADAGAEADTIFGGNLKVASQMTEGYGGELGKAKLNKLSCKASPRKRKVAFSSANDVEGGDPSSASLTSGTPTTSMQKSCSLLGQKEEDIISSAMSIENQKGVGAKKATTKKKGKHKRRGRVVLVRWKRSTKLMLAEATDQACESKTMAIESVEAAVPEIALGNKDAEVATENNVESGAKEKDHDNQSCAEGTVDAGVETDRISGKNLELSSVQSSQMDGELGTAKPRKSSCKSSSKKRKVAFNTTKDVEGWDPSCASPSLETSTKSMEKSSSLCSKKEEELLSVLNIEKQGGFVAKKATVKKKGRHKRRGRVLLARSKQSSKPKAQVEFKRRADAIKQLVELDIGPKNSKIRKSKEGLDTAVVEQDIQTREAVIQVVNPILKRREVAIKQPVDSSQVEELDAGPKNRKNRKLKEGQVTTVAEQDPQTGKTVKQVVNPNLKRSADAIKHSVDSSQVQELETGPKNRKIRKLKEGQVTAVTEEDSQTGKSVKQAVNSILVITRKQGSIQKLKDKKGACMTSIAKQKGHKSKDSITQTDLIEMQDNGLLLSLSSLEKTKRGRSRSPDPGLQLDKSDQEEAKEIFIGQSHDGNASSSARKRMKQMLPPPLPSPVMSVSKQLVSKAFGLKTSKSGRLLVPPLAHWRGQSLVRDMDGGIIAIEDGSQGTPLETGCFNFKPPIEARAKKLQEWLSETASKCLTKRLNARRKGSQSKTAPD